MRAKSLLASLLMLCLYIIDCTAPQAQQVALRGEVVTPTEVLPDHVVLISGDKIDRVQPTPGLPQLGIDTDSYIFPGLIDLHDHLTWNFLPRWKPNQLFSNRYEWQQTAAYKTALVDPHSKVMTDPDLACDADRFGEIKAIIGGATSVVGGLTVNPTSTGNNCILGLARNLDSYPSFDQGPSRIRYEVFPFELGLSDSAKVRASLESGTLNAFLIHVGEGKASDAAAAREFKMLVKGGDGFMHSGVSVIHGAAFGKYEFEQMAGAGVGLIWSPRSNIELYGTTTDVRSAKTACVPAGTPAARIKCLKIALAPDWSPSGSDGMLEELQYAATWNASQHPPIFDDSELVKMATSVPAQLVGADKQIGSIAKGMYADLLLIRKKEKMQPYQALLHASPGDVRLVMIGGLPVYGDQDLMERLLPGRQLESLTVCGTAKRLYIEPQSGIPATQKTLQQISEELKAKLAASGLPLAELAPCQ